MMPQPDKLFREKLENFQRPASAAAWERIEGGLNNNQSNGIWLKFAAGLTLFAVATYFMWPTNPIENQQAANTNIDTPQTEQVEKKLSEKTLTTTPTKKTERTIAKTKATKKVEPVITTEPVIETQESAGYPVVQPTEIQVAVVETNSIETVPTKTIVYTAEEVNARFLRKKSSSEATLSPEKSSGIQKLMGLAYTIKNPENGLGDLRQKKDEILALNFLSKEDKTNKEKN